MCKRLHYYVIARPVKVTIATRHHVIMLHCQAIGRPLIQIMKLSCLVMSFNSARAHGSSLSSVEYFKTSCHVTAGQSSETSCYLRFPPWITSSQLLDQINVYFQIPTKRAEKLKSGTASQQLHTQRNTEILANISATLRRTRLYLIW